MNGDEQTTHQEILQREMTAGRRELGRPASGLLWSGLAGGFEVGLSAFAVAIVTGFEAQLSEPVFELVRASAYSVGFLVVIFGRSELFTEHTTLAVLPVLGGKGTVYQLLRLWTLILVSNLAGTVVFGALLSYLGQNMSTASPAILQSIADDILKHDADVMFVSAVTAGWMMGLVSWLNSAGTETISRIVFTWLVTSMIGFAHLHHSIVGSVELMAAWLSGASIGAGIMRFLPLVVLGNALGGSIFVALVKFAHARPASAGEP